jgi:hypothetical protein
LSLLIPADGHNKHISCVFVGARHASDRDDYAMNASFTVLAVVALFAVFEGGSARLQSPPAGLSPFSLSKLLQKANKEALPAPVAERPMHIHSVALNNGNLATNDNTSALFAVSANVSSFVMPVRNVDGSVSYKNVSLPRLPTNATHFFVPVNASGVGLFADSSEFFAGNISEIYCSSTSAPIPDSASVEHFSLASNATGVLHVSNITHTIVTAHFNGSSNGMPVNLPAYSSELNSAVNITALLLNIL